MDQTVIEKKMSQKRGGEHNAPGDFANAQICEIEAAPR